MKGRELTGIHTPPHIHHILHRGHTGKHSKMSEEGTYTCTLDASSLKKAKKELGEDPKQRASQIDTFRNWVKAQPHLTCRTDDGFLLRFLRSAKFSQLKAQEKLDNFVSVRCSPAKGVPEWFSDMDPLDPTMDKVLDMALHVPLPGKDDEGRKVVLMRTGAFDPATLDYGMVMKLGFMNGDILLLDEGIQVNGVVVLLDFGQFGKEHVLMYTRDLLSKCMKCWQDVYPTRNKAIHYYDTPSMFTAFYEVVKLFMKDKMKKRLHFHKGSKESLCKAIPKRMLPTEYGGDAGPLADIAKSWKEELIKKSAELELNARTMAVDDSKRPKKVDDELGDFGLMGSFRKLTTD